jgi:hypothetical protein
MKSKLGFKIHTSLFLASILLILVVVAVLIIANLQPKSWLISESLSYPELIPTTGQFPFGDILQETIQTNSIYQFPAHIIAIGLKLIVPLNLVRIAYLGLLLAVAGLGIFALISRILNIVNKHSHTYLPATAATLLYLASMLPIQTFYSLNMPVITAFAFIPALLASALTYLQTRRSRWLMLFGALNILAFEIGGSLIMFGLLAACLGLAIFILQGYLKASWKRILQILLVFGSVHLIWFVPAMINNSLVSQASDFTIYNHLPLVAQLVDVGLMNNFTILNSFVSDWATYLNSPLIAGIIVAVAISSVLGFSYLSWRVKGRLKLAFIVPLICHLLIALINIGILTGSVTAFGIAPLKQILGYIFTLGLVTELAILVDAFLHRYLKRLNQNLITLWLIISSAGVLLASLLMLPALQNHLYPPSAQASLPASYDQLFAFFRTNHTDRNIWYVTDALTANADSFEYKKSVISLAEYALGQPLISLTDPKTAEVYTRLQHTLASGNPVNIADELEQANVDWIVVDRINLNSESFALSTPQLGPLLEDLDVLTKVEWIDANVTDLLFYKVDRDASQITSENGGILPFKNLPADRATIDRVSKTLHLFAPLPDFPPSNISLPALNRLNLENVSLEFVPDGSQLNVVAHGFYPQLLTGTSSVTTAIDNIHLAVVAKPTNQYVVVVGEQIFGPFSPNAKQSVLVSKLSLQQEQNMRMYELYDLNDVTSTFQRQLAGDCNTNAPVFDTETLTSGATVTINSEREACITADLPIIETDASVVTRLSYDYVTNALLSQCMFNKQSQECINPAVPVEFSDTTLQSQSVIEELGKVGISDLQTKFFLQYLGAERVLSANISNIVIEEYKLINSSTLSVSDWDKPQLFSIPDVPLIEAVLPYTSLQFAAFSSAEYFDSFKHCTEGQQLELINQGETRALNASSQNRLCFYQDYEPVTANKAHLIFLDYKLANAAEVDLCVWDMNRQLCVTRTKLIGTDFRSEKLVSIPRGGTGEAAYRLIFSTLENINTDLIISDVQLIEADADTLQALSLTDGVEDTLELNETIESTAETTRLIEVILVLQGIILLVCFALPAAKEVLVKNIIAKSK